MQDNAKKKIIVVHGPTASGKSRLALDIAKNFNGFLISADSRMVYKEMDIGTNKDKGEWIDKKFYVNGVEEYMIDEVLPNQDFSVDDWVKKVERIISSEKRIPIIVGGTNLYLDSLIYNFELPIGKNEKLRAKLEKEVDQKGLPSLVRQIKEIDPDIENKIDIMNPRRVIRAAEICLQTKQPLVQKRGEPRYNVLQIGINKNREELYDKINKRVDEMIEEGLVEEVTELQKKYGCDLPAMTAIGYRQLCQALSGEISQDEAVELIKRDTRRYAKRQLTWLKREKDINWIKEYKEVEKILKKFV